MAAAFKGRATDEPTLWLKGSSLSACFIPQLHAAFIFSWLECCIKGRWELLLVSISSSVLCSCKVKTKQTESINLCYYEDLYYLHFQIKSHFLSVGKTYTQFATILENMQTMSNVWVQKYSQHRGIIKLNIMGDFLTSSNSGRQQKEIITKCHKQQYGIGMLTIWSFTKWVVNCIIHDKR